MDFKRIAIALLIGTGGLFAGCSRNAAAPGGQPVAAPHVSAEETARQALLEAQHTLLAVGAYRVRSTATDASGKVTKSGMDFVAPDSWRLIEPGKETIVIGATHSTYTRKNGGPWTKQAHDMSAQLMSLRADPARLDRYSQSWRHVQHLAPSKLSGVATEVYQYLNSEGTVTTWVGKEEELILKAETKQHTPAGDSTMTSVYDYNADLQIDAPPVAAH